MNNSSLSPYTYAYQPVQGIPEYIDFTYQLNWVSIFYIIVSIYTIPCIAIFVKIAFFYFKNEGKIKKTGLRMEIFQSFLLMQFWNIWLIIGEFAECRIPFTTVFTSFCASENPQFLLKTIVFLYHWGFYTSQVFTFLFCALRVAVLYSISKRRTEKVITILPCFVMPLGFLVALPHTLSEGMCIQVFVPYPFGSIFIHSHFYYDNLKIVSIGNFFFSSSITFIILLLSYFMMRKIRERKLLSIQQSSRSSKAEKTLTGTMIILLVPLLINQFVAIATLFNLPFSSYILFCRPLFLDARVHFVTCYFYLTHPVFKAKKQTMIVQLSSGSPNLSHGTSKVANF